MPNAVRCDGCDAALAVPAGAVGKVLRCPRCGTLNPIPADPPEPEPEPPPRARADRAPRRRGRDDTDDWDDRPRRRRPKGVPGWVWAAAGSAAAVAVVVALGLVLALRKGDPDRSHPQVENPPPDPKQLAEQGMAPETWVRRTHEPSGASWEFPTTGECWELNSIVRVADQKPLSFTVTVKDVPLVPKIGRSPVEDLRKAAPGGLSPFGPVESTRTVDGRPAVVIRAPNYTSLVVAEPGRTWEFKVFLPQRDEGEARTRRFFDSVRITRSMPADPSAPVGVTPVAGAGKAPDSGEAIPPGWDRVQLPKTTFTLLMPKNPAPQWAQKNRMGSTSYVVRGLVTPAGEDVVVVASYVEAKEMGPAIADPFGGVTEKRELTVGGHTARLWVREFGGVSFATLQIELGGLKFINVGINSQAKLDANSPVVRRVLDSLSFTLPPKAGAELPEDYNPAWTRRFAPGGSTFSVEIPGPGGPANEGGLGMAGGVAWTSKGRLPLRDDRFGLHFTASAVGGLGAVPDPRKTIEQEIGLLPQTRGAPQFIRRVDVAGRPGYVAAKTDANGVGSVRLKLQDRMMMYQLDAVGRGLTADSPEVKRFFDSIRFDLTRPTSPGPAGNPGGVLEVPVPKKP